MAASSCFQVAKSDRELLGSDRRGFPRCRAATATWILPKFQLSPRVISWLP